MPLVLGNEMVHESIVFFGESNAISRFRTPNTLIILFGSTKVLVKGLQRLQLDKILVFFCESNANCCFRTPNALIIIFTA